MPIIPACNNCAGDHLTCEADSITVCQGTVPWIVQGLDPIARDLDCELDSVTVCPPVSGAFDVNVINDFATWFETDTAANALATATKIAGATEELYLTGVSFSFDVVPSAGVILEIADDLAVLRFRMFVAEQSPVEFSHPIKFEAGRDIIATLAAGGTGSTGIVSIWGYTLNV